MDLGQLFDLMNSGRQPTSEEMKDAAVLLRGMATGKVPPGAQDQFGSDYAAFARTLSQGFSQAANTPQGRNFTNMLIRERQSDRFIRQYKPFFNAVLAGADVATALSQIKGSNKALQSLVPPTAPAAPKIDNAINGQIANAQRGTLSSENALAPARQEIQGGYQRDLQTARAVSGGQSSTFGALANAASLRRTRAGTGLPMIADSIKAREQSRLDDLLFRRQGLNQQNFENNMGLYGQQLNSYNQDVNAVSALGQAGRTNLRTAAQSLPDSLLGISGRLFPVNNPYVETDYGSGPIPSPASHSPMLNDVFNQYGTAVGNSLRSNLSRIQAKGPRQSLY